jgi:hypothetical protein
MADLNDNNARPEDQTVIHEEVDETYDKVEDDLAGDTEAAARAAEEEERDWREVMEQARQETLPIPEDNPFRTCTYAEILAAVKGSYEKSPTEEERAAIDDRCRHALEAAVCLATPTAEMERLVKAVAKAMGVSVKAVWGELREATARMRQHARDMEDTGGRIEPWLAAMNRRYVVCDGQLVRMNLSADEIAATGALFEQEKMSAFELRFANRFVDVFDPMLGRNRTMPLNEAWVAAAGRRDVDRMGMWDVGREPARSLNLWKGLSVTPRKQAWHQTEYFLREVICAGNQANYDFLIKLLATWVRNPLKKSETTIALVAGQGVGKGVFYKMLRRIFGAPYCLATASHERLFGRFNAHLAGRVLVFIDEAVFGGRRELAGKLKNMQSEDTLEVEAKYCSSVYIRNFIHWVVASNEAKALPIDTDDRRNLILEVSPIHKRDTAYFANLHKAWDEGDLSGFLHHLLHEIDLTGFDPHLAPMTDAKAALVMTVGHPTERFVMDLLISRGDGILPDAQVAEWATGPIEILKEDMLGLFKLWHAMNGDKREYTPTQQEIGTTIGRIFGKTVSTKMIKKAAQRDKRAYRLAPAAECIAEIKKHHAWSSEWDD